MATTTQAAPRAAGGTENGRRFEGGPGRTVASEAIRPGDVFAPRHIGPSDADAAEMLRTTGFASLDALTDATVPASIRLSRPLTLAGLPEEGWSESEALGRLRGVASQNLVLRSFIGQGYHGTITPPVILRNIMENPGWYTQYTPYQAEISQGRLEALLNFQTMVADLTGLPLAGASLLDEATAAAEAMAMCFAIGGESRKKFLVADDCHPQTIAVCKTRAASMGIELVVVDGPALRAGVMPTAAGSSTTPSCDICGVLVQYPTTDGRIECYRELCQHAHASGALVVAATDLLALTLITPPGEWGADVAIGSAQRFGVPMGFGGPHAAFIATRTEHARKMPGRIIGVSRDAHGNPALRMAIQTREQHIKRERATSNICTAQALLAIMAGMYAVYHGPEGLRAIARRVHDLTRILANGLRWLGHEVSERNAYFDTVRVRPVIGEHCKNDAEGVLRCAVERGVNLRNFGDGTLGIALDETTTIADVQQILASFGCGRGFEIDLREPVPSDPEVIPPVFRRTTPFLSHPVFNTHHSESEMLRYIFKLQGRDLSLAHSMIPLGSCTMKLNATSEMQPVTWPEFGDLHPFAPAEQSRGYQQVFRDLETWLAEITGFAAVSLQPNAGSQGEYAGLLAILPQIPRPGPARHLPHSRLGARHQPGQRGDRGHEGGRGRV